MLAVSVVPLNVRLAEPPNAPLLLNCTCVFEPPGDAVTDAKDKVPDPLVCKYCPLEPSALGRVKLTVFAVFGPTKLTAPPRFA